MKPALDVAKLVTQLVNKEIDPKSLSKDQRRNCVEFCRYQLRQDIAKIARLLQVQMTTVRADLRFIHVSTAKFLEHGQMSSEIIGEIYERLQANYQLALDKKDVAGANKATEMLKVFWQDLGRMSKADQVVRHEGLSILDLARAASVEDEKEEPLIH